MTLLLEPPVEVAWAEDAGLMSLVFENEQVLSPPRDPDPEMALWLSALEVAAPVGDWRVS